MENEFPPNSHARNDPRPVRGAVERKPEKKEVVRVTKGKTIQRKKPLRKKFVEAFRPEDGSGFVEYTLLEILVPGIKGAIADATTTAIENALGVGGRGHTSRSRGRGHVSYSRMSDPRDRRDDRRPPRRETRRSSDVPEIILESRVEAELVIDQLFEQLSRYGVATMRDLLSMVGEPHNQIDEDWGWTDLRGSRAHRIREGYLIDLPRPEPLD